MIPERSDGAEVDLVRTLVHQLEAFGVRLHQPVFDGVVDHLDVVTGAVITHVQIAVGRRQRHEDRLEPVFLTLAPPNGYLRVGDHGAGHYVKMIHNGIEYGMMQAYAEGFELMHDGSYKLDVSAIAELWNHGSVVRSWLLELTARALSEDRDLSDLEAYVEDSGEGRWTVQEGIEKAIPLPVLTAAIFTRFRSREKSPFAERLLAAMRNQFGGHAVKKRNV